MSERSRRNSLWVFGIGVGATFAGCGRVDPSGLSSVGVAGFAPYGTGGVAGTPGASGTGLGGGVSGVGGVDGTGGLGGSAGVVSCADGTAPAEVCDGASCDRAIFTAVSFVGTVTIAGQNLVLSPSPVPTGADGRRGVCEDKVDGAARTFAVRPTEAGFLSAHLVQATFDESTGEITGNTSFDSVLYATTDCDVSSMVVCSDNYAVVDGAGALGGGEVISLQVLANTTYYIVVQGRETDSTGAFKLELSLAHGTCFDPVRVPLDPSFEWDGYRVTYAQLAGDTTGNGDHGQPECAPAGAPDVVYQLDKTPPSPAANSKGVLAYAASTGPSPPDLWLSLTRTSICDDPTVSPGEHHGCSEYVTGVGVSSKYADFLWVDGWVGDREPGYPGKPTEGPYRIEITN